MSIASTALYAYYEKCGVSDADAKLIAASFGDDFITKQNEARQMGLGNLSKASAAQGISDRVVHLAHWDDRFPRPANLNSRENIETAIRIIRAASLCSIAVGGYALQEDQSRARIATFNAFLDCPKMLALPLLSEADRTSEKQKFAETATRLAIESMALGRRKGLFSSLLG